MVLEFDSRTTSHGNTTARDTAYDQKPLDTLLRYEVVALQPLYPIPRFTGVDIYDYFLKALKT